MYNAGFYLVSVSPAHNETGVAVNAGISLKFSMDMIEDSLSASTLMLTKVNGGTIDSTITYQRTNRTVYIKPVSNLEDGTQYRLEVVGGDNGVTSITGMVLPESRFYDFKTTGSVALSAPLNLKVTINPGYLTLDWVRPVQFDPTKELSYRAYISTSSLNPTEDPASVVWPLTADSMGPITGLTVNVGRDLPPARYYAYVLAANEGQTSSYVQFQFLIEEPVQDETPSDNPSYPVIGGVFEVHATYPVADSVNIALDGIKILFTDDLDLATVTNSSVYVIKAPKPKSLTIIDFMTKFSPSKAIPFTIDAPEMNNMISLTVDPTLIEANTEYTVVVRETIKSVSGESLGEAFAWSFVSTYTPLFGDAERIRDDIKVFLRNVPDKVLYRYMHDTSLGALDIVSTVVDNYNQETFLANPPRYMAEYVRYQTGYDLIVNAVTQELNGIGSSRTLGDLTVQANNNIGQITPLLETFKARIKRWEDELHGHHNRGYAKPTTAVKGETGAAYPTHLTRTELTDPSEG